MPSPHFTNQISMPDFEQLVLYTGNVMRTTTTANNAWNQKSNTELMQAIQDTLQTSLFGSDKPSFRYYTETKLLEVPDLRMSSRIHPDDREDIEVTAKLFFLDRCDEYQISNIDKAIHHLQQLLDVQSIDTFVVSFDQQQDASAVKKAWKDLEAYHHRGVISKLGLSDFDIRALEAFLKNPECQVKPSIDQVHFNQCSELPRDLVEFGKQNGVEITFNGDTTDILTTESLTKLLKNNIALNETTQVKPRWVLKYNVFYKSRSIVADKG
ncbi:Glutamate--cysteine ligase regulatory subunit [Choanephora cucurbitarum]|uniref:GCS light chain n=1 Tax=Choanephora cucurbitarum TaxID=101091 RepID=A0A1C7NPH7_9FUNG|nr:Glutamate--cysteine ligase regulatory subunit [Choanephora cucurbitarum]